LDFLRRIEPYQRVTPTPLAVFRFCAASGLKRATAAEAMLVRPGLFLVPFVLFLVPFVFVSGSSGLLEQVKGWRR
jgi:hypothetical protein